MNHIQEFLNQFGATTVKRMALVELFNGHYVSRESEWLSKRSNAVHSLISFFKNDLHIPIFSRKIPGSEVKEYFIPRGFLKQMKESEQQFNTIRQKTSVMVEERRINKALKKHAETGRRLAAVGLIGGNEHG